MAQKKTKKKPSRRTFKRRYAFKFLYRTDHGYGYPFAPNHNGWIDPKFIDGKMWSSRIGGKLSLCSRGYHACLTYQQLLQWSAGWCNHLFLVELLDGELGHKDENKVIARQYRIIGKCSPSVVANRGYVWPSSTDLIKDVKQLLFYLDAKDQDRVLRQLGLLPTPKKRKARK